MKKLLFATLILLLILGLLTGCGARRQAMTATAMSQALTATAMAQPPVATAPAMAQPPVVTAPAVSTPATSGVILFQDDFQDGQPDGWQITTAWYVQQEGNVYYFSASGQGGVWVPQGGNWADYEFQAAVRVTTGGVVLNYRMTGEGRYLLHFREDGLYLTKEYPKGSYTTLTQTAAPSLNAWHQVAVAGYGGHLQVYVDRTLQLDYTDPSPLLRGTIGMTTKEDYQTAVDDVLVTRLTAALPTAVPMALPPTVAPPAAPLPAEAGLPLEEVPPPEEAPLPSAAGLPVIDYFRSEPSERAGCYYLHWDLHEASAAYLNGEGVIAPDSREVCPEETTTYTLRAENAVGSVEETVTIEVGGAPPPPPAAGQPDLEIGEVSVWVPMPVDPKRVAVTIEVRNVGSGPAGAFTVRWYPHQASGEVGCSLDVMGLPANSAQILDDCPSYTYAQKGEMHWRAVVDEDNEIQNDPKGNNEARGTVRIEAGGGVAEDTTPPEVNITHSPDSPTTADRVTFTATASDPSGIDRIEIIDQMGGDVVKTCDSSPCVYQGGPYPPGFRNYLAAAYDTHGNRGHTSWKGLTVVAAGPVGQPDLVIRDLMILPDDTVKPGEQFAVTFRVQNNGNAPAGPSTACWKTVGSTGLSCDCNVPEVGAGGSYRCDCSPLVVLSTPVNPTNFGTRATADCGNVVAESDEGNNKSESVVLKVHP